VVFLSPPWGGPAYADAAVFDIVTMMGGLDGAKSNRRRTTVEDCGCLSLRSPRWLLRFTCTTHLQSVRRGLSALWRRDARRSRSVQVFNAARAITSNVVYYLPRNCNPEQAPILEYPSTPAVPERISIVSAALGLQCCAITLGTLGIAYASADP